MNTIPSISIDELEQRITSGEPVTLLDVRTKEEYERIHAAGALLIPLDELDVSTLKEKLKQYGQPPEAAIYVLCHSGHRAMNACEQVFDHLPHVVHVQGGTLAWAQQGLPVASGPEPGPR
jgi:rhodanese-related sulfurtransferase